jgi:hypothetical protein
VAYAGYYPTSAAKSAAASINTNMDNWKEWKHSQVAEILEVKEWKEVSKEELYEIASAYFLVALRQPRLVEWADHRNQTFIEAVEASRYAIEVNYRTTMKDAQEGYAKIALGYVSAALKAHGFHVKMVFTEKPMRLLVSSRNWDDGEWVGMITYNPDHSCFMLCRGFYNRERKTISIQKHDKMDANSPAEMASELRNLMHTLKDTPDAHQEKLKPVPLKRGPKRS